MLHWTMFLRRLITGSFVCQICLFHHENAAATRYFTRVPWIFGLLPNVMEKIPRAVYPFLRHKKYCRLYVNIMDITSTNCISLVKIVKYFILAGYGYGSVRVQKAGDFLFMPRLLLTFTLI